LNHVCVCLSGKYLVPCHGDMCTDLFDVGVVLQQSTAYASLTVKSVSLSKPYSDSPLECKNREYYN
jgi:hypothetical protein